MFGVPLEELGFTPNRGRAQSAIEEGEAAVRRRSFLHGALAAATPQVSSPGGGRLTAQIVDASRYKDRYLVDHLRAALDEAARADGSTGPRNALPKAMDILCVIDVLAHEASDTVRKDLLAIGARAAEFTAFLHRDAGAPPHVALYFYDRAAEWATVTGDGPMQAYVLLRKAQAIDRRDAARMLDLAHAAAHGPWKLPPRARAEALQQHARALALTGSRPDTIAHSLDQAHKALSEAGPAEPPTCTGPLCAGYNTDRLMAQSAISYREAGQSTQAVDLLQQHLTRGVFAPRDRAFFSAHLAGALAAAGEPDQAATTGLTALRLAAGPGFGQALAEIRRTLGDLRPHARRPAVRELRQALTTLTPV